MKRDNNWRSVGIAMALPSTLFGVIYLINLLVQKKIISSSFGYIILGIVVIYMFYLMIRLANDKND